MVKSSKLGTSRLVIDTVKRWIFYGPTSSRTKHHLNFPLASLMSSPMRQEQRRAKEFFACIRWDNLCAIHIFSASRGGSHAFGTRFHFLPCAFVFGENIFTKTPHRAPLTTHPNVLHPVDFLLASCFREFGLQDKRGDLLTHLIYMHNKYIPDVSAEKTSFCNSFFIHYFRNPLRTAISRMKAAEAAEGRKPRWRMDLDRLRVFFESERKRFHFADECAARDPGRVKLCLHECFAADPKAGLIEVGKFCGINDRCLAAECTPQSFFKRCFASDETLEISDGFLRNGKEGRRITGIGGNYNPLNETRIERALIDNPNEALSASEIAIAREVFRSESVDFWLNDTAETYRNITLSGALQMFR